MAPISDNAFLRFGFVALCFAGQSSAMSSPNLRPAAAPGYQDREICPTACHLSGPASGNWSLYHNFDQIASCDLPIWYDFTLVDPVDDATKLHRIYACTNSGLDWSLVPADRIGADAGPSTNTTTGTYEFGYWPKSNDTFVAADTRTLSLQLQHYLSNGFTSPDRTSLLFASSGTTSVGLYIGKGLQSHIVGTFALKYLQNATLSSNLSSMSGLAIQYCERNSTADHILGFIATSNSSFGSVQNALSLWSNATCLSIPEVSSQVTGPIAFTSPLYSSSASDLMTTNLILSSGNSTALSGTRLSIRSDCSTVEVVSGDSCASLAQKCGISGSNFAQYNPGSEFCATLTPHQHVCCSPGTLPDFAPKEKADGSCYSYTVVANDNCANLAAMYSLTNDMIESYNKDTWAWNGCSNLFIGTIICLSPGTPPMPAALSNAVCGPQKPGTSTPPLGTNMSMLNPCPLNACCDAWGQCGITDDFCTNTNTGAPGTARPGQNGCISNCGTDIVQSEAPQTYRNIAFFEGYNLGRPCLYQAVEQIDTSSYTHLMFSFGTLDPTYNVQTGDTASTFQFEQFKAMNGVKKVLSIGGWAFSTDPSTYSIFRKGVTAADRQSMVHNIASFVKSNGLDGLNIDWEYPGALDIPGIPPASSEDGANYLEFLKLLKAQLPESEISVCAPASYWYLRVFPIANMTEVLDYIIYMTYDLHGQWDANNRWSQEGCPSGSCLRSDVNLTETTRALAMITKAGVPSNKIIVGVTSYGRSFAMSDAGCYGPDCTYLGSTGVSQATPGNCTRTAGYIANAEINAILQNSSRVNQHYVDSTSNSNILVYDNTQWVGYMDDDTKSSRSQKYQGWSMGGVTDWAVDLQQYNDPPARSSSWLQFISKVKSGKDPADVGERTGNWTSIPCTDRAVTDIRDLSPQQRWDELDAPNAWSDVITVWETIDRDQHHLNFTESISDTIHGPEGANCGKIEAGSQCEQTIRCSQADGAGPAGYEIWNSFVYINGMYSEYWTALNGAAATQLSSSLSSFETTFAPIPIPKSDEWEQILIAIVTLGASLISAPFFNSIFKALPIFDGNGNTLGVLKDTTSALITFGSNIAKDTVSPGSQNQWTPEDQADFSAYLGQAMYVILRVDAMSPHVREAQVTPHDAVSSKQTPWMSCCDTIVTGLICGSSEWDNEAVELFPVPSNLLLTPVSSSFGWTATTTNTLAALFNGSDSSISTLSTILGNGNLVEGNGGTPDITAGESSITDVENTVFKGFYAFAIPSVWTVAGYAPFILASGEACGIIYSDGDCGPNGGCSGSTDPIYNYVTDAGATANACWNDNKVYYLVYPPGTAGKNPRFDELPGAADLSIDQNQNTPWGGVTVQDLIFGSIRSYEANGNQNGAPLADPANSQTLSDLINTDITTPGYIRLPVCSAATAMTAWTNPSRVDISDPNYPCVSLQGVTKCDSYHFTNGTSDASPYVSDCQDIIQNIQGTSGSWTTTLDRTRRIVSAGTCALSVEEDESDDNGNASYQVGSQDVVDIINQSINLFASNSKVGASGTFECNGNIKVQPNLKWNLYHI